MRLYEINRLSYSDTGITDWTFEGTQINALSSDPFVALREIRGLLIIGERKAAVVKDMETGEYFELTEWVDHKNQGVHKMPEPFMT